MAVVQIRGNKKLAGEVLISGSKNSVLPIMASSVLCQGITVLEHCPDIGDVHSMIKILESLGAEVSFKGGTLRIDTTHRMGYEICEKDANKIRASILLLGPLLAKEKRVKIGYPGGCKIGERPVDIHVDGFMHLNAGFMIRKDYLSGETFSLVGNKIRLRYPSVGATQNIMMAATLANGKTMIENAAKEPEVVYLARHLRSMGASIEGEGTSKIIIIGVEELYPCTTVIPYDRIEAATYLILAHVTKSEISIFPITDIHDMCDVVSLIQDAGGIIKHKGEKLIYIPSLKNQPIQIETGPFPMTSTDIQSMSFLLGMVADGKSSIRENVFENRFAFVDEIIKMGADIQVHERIAVVNGSQKLHGAKVFVPDLRAGAALCIAALAADGVTQISNWELVERGYENFVYRLRQIGADIEYCE